MNPDPKRILFVHYGDNFIRGSERCLLDLICHIDKKQFTPIVWCNSRRLAVEVNKLGVEVIEADFIILFCGYKQRFSLMQFFKMIRVGLKIVAAKKIDLIHANSGTPNQWMNIIARIKRLPLLSHLHARYPLRERIVMGLLLPSMTVGVSQPVIDQLLQDGVCANLLKVIPNGIDTQYHEAMPAVDIRRMLSIPANQHVIMTVASLIHRKGIDLLIQAVAQLRLIQIPVHLIIAGDGPQKESLMAKVGGYNLNANIHFLGECRNIPALLRGGVDVFVSGAREEVFGLVLAEANLASIPVVAPRVGGISSVIEHNQTGLLVKPENSSSIAKAVAHLLHRPKLRLRYGKAGKEKVLREFNIEQYVLRFQVTYLDLINDKSKQLHFNSNLHLLPISRLLFRGFSIFLKNILLALRNKQACIQSGVRKIQ